jgi:membrane protein implicated in regulation of membrane protease activity
VKAWLLWVLVAAFLTMVEVATVTLVFLMLAAGAAAAALAAGLGGGVVAQFAALAAVSVGSLGAVRPIAYRRLHAGPEHKNGVEALVGREAVVTHHVDGHDGRVRIGGEVWSARSYDGHSEFEVGTRVDVAQIEGATALVL